MAKNMTEGKPLKLILAFMFPALSHLSMMSAVVQPEVPC